MVDMQILSEKAVDMHQLKKELEKIKARDKELNFRATRTEEYLNQFTTVKNPEGLFKEIESLKVPRIKEQHIAKIIDLLPTNLEDIKMMLKAYPVTITNENLKRIVELVNKHLVEK